MHMCLASTSGTGHTRRSGQAWMSVTKGGGYLDWPDRPIAVLGQKCECTNMHREGQVAMLHAAKDAQEALPLTGCMRAHGQICWHNSYVQMQTAPYSH